MLFINVISQGLISIKMSVSTFGRVHQANKKEMDNKSLSEIHEKLMKNLQEISDLKIFRSKEFLKKNKLMMNVKQLCRINFRNKIKKIKY